MANHVQDYIPLRNVDHEVDIERNCSPLERPSLESETEGHEPNHDESHVEFQGDDQSNRPTGGQSLVRKCLSNTVETCIRFSAPIAALSFMTAATTLFLRDVPTEGKDIYVPQAAGRYGNSVVCVDLSVVRRTYSGSVSSSDFAFLNPYHSVLFKTYDSPEGYKGCIEFTTGKDSKSVPGTVTITLGSDEATVDVSHHFPSPLCSSSLDSKERPFDKAADSQCVLRISSPKPHEVSILTDKGMGPCMRLQRL